MFRLSVRAHMAQPGSTFSIVKHALLRRSGAQAITGTAALSESDDVVLVDAMLVADQVFVASKPMPKKKAEMRGQWRPGSAPPAGAALPRTAAQCGRPPFLHPRLLEVGTRSDRNAQQLSRAPWLRDGSRMAKMRWQSRASFAGPAIAACHPSNRWEFVASPRGSSDASSPEQPPLRACAAHPALGRLQQLRGAQCVTLERAGGDQGLPARRGPAAGRLPARAGHLRPPGGSGRRQGSWERQRGLRRRGCGRRHLRPHHRSGAPQPLTRFGRLRCSVEGLFDVRLGLWQIEHLVGWR